MKRAAPWLALALALPAAPTSAQAIGAAPYVDRVLDEEPQPQLQAERELRSHDPTGLPRGVRIDYGIAADRGGQRSTSHGLSVNAFVDTPDYGNLSVDATAGRSRGMAGQGASTWRWRLDQRGMPFDGGWLASQAAGHINTVQVPLATSVGRVGLPTAPILGLSTQWQQARGVHLNASVGGLGLFTGTTNTGFQSGEGAIGAAGIQLPLGERRRADGQPASVLAAQAVVAQGVPDSVLPGSQRRDTQSLWVAWSGSTQRMDPGGPRLPAGTLAPGELRWQANMLASSSRLAGTASRGAGAWADLSWRGAGLLHTAGAFRFAPGLRWGSYIAASDLQGAYWRGEWSSRRLQISGDVERSTAVSADGPGDSGYAAVSSRWRLDTRSSVGAFAALRTGTGAGRALQFSADRLGTWGATSVRLEGSRSLSRRLLRGVLDQQWALATPQSLATTLSLERTTDRLSGASVDVLGWAVLAHQELGRGITVDANLRGVAGRGARQLSGGLGATWALPGGWSLVLQASALRGSDPLAPLLTSAFTDATTQAATVPELSARRLAVVLRHQQSAGSPQAPLGGARGEGAGGIEGSVWLDANGNRQREAQEPGVPDVIVLLDRRYAVRTDAQGRYAFPLVAAGTHVLELLPDDIPLPWSPQPAGPMQVRVQVRDTATQDFPLQRER